MYCACFVVLVAFRGSAASFCASTHRIVAGTCEVAMFIDSNVIAANLQDPQWLDVKPAVSALSVCALRATRALC